MVYNISKTTLTQVEINNLYCAISEKKSTDILLKGISADDNRILLFDSIDKAFNQAIENDGRPISFLLIEVDPEKLNHRNLLLDERTGIFEYRDTIPVQHLKGITLKIREKEKRSGRKPKKG